LARSGAETRLAAIESETQSAAIAQRDGERDVQLQVTPDSDLCAQVENMLNLRVSRLFDDRQRGAAIGAARALALDGAAAQCAAVANGNMSIEWVFVFERAG
jgi:hypothetical protein